MIEGNPGEQPWGAADGSNTAQYRSEFGCLGACGGTGSGAAGFDIHGEAPATYTSGAPGVPVDFNNNSLFDVLPLQSNEQKILLI